MKVTLNPLVQSASGKINNVVFQNRRNSPTVTRFRKARNPQSEGQIETRALLRHASLVFGGFDFHAKDAWDRKVNGVLETGVSVFISDFVRFFRGRENLSDYRFIQSDRGAAPPGFIEVEREFPGIRITLNDFPVHEGFHVSMFLFYLVRSFNPIQRYDVPPILTRFLFAAPRGVFFVFPPEYDFYAGGSIYYESDDGTENFYSDAAIGFAPRLVG